MSPPGRSTSCVSWVYTSREVTSGRYLQCEVELSYFSSLPKFRPLLTSSPDMWPFYRGRRPTSSPTYPVLASLIWESSDTVTRPLDLGGCVVVPTTAHLSASRWVFHLGCSHPWLSHTVTPSGSFVTSSWLFNRPQSLPDLHPLKWLCLLDLDTNLPSVDLLDNWTFSLVGARLPNWFCNTHPRYLSV